MHIDRIASEWQTSTIELQRHSSIFGDIAVQFPKDDLNLIEAIFNKASVRPRNIVLARYEKYFARPHKVLDTYLPYDTVRIKFLQCIIWPSGSVITSTSLV